MNRLTKTYRDKTYKIFGVADDLPCGENSYDFKNLLIQKLGEYEDLEEQGLLIKIKPIKDFENRYGVDEFGNVYSFNGKYKNTIIRKPYIHNKYGYVYVNLKQNNEVKNMRVHRLVAEAFIPNPDNKPQVNHIDGDTFNNKADNLEWCTDRENKIHAIETGLRNVFNIKQEELEKLYTKDKMTLNEIADKFNISRVPIEKSLKKFNIKKRTISEAKRKYNLTENYISKELKSKTQKELAKEIGCDQSLISHYVKRIKERGKIYE